MSTRELKPQPNRLMAAAGARLGDPQGARFTFER